jgi:hypothetical protein
MLVVSQPLVQVGVEDSATALDPGSVAFFAKESTDRGIRGGWNQSKTAGKDPTTRSGSRLQVPSTNT